MPASTRATTSYGFKLIYLREWREYRIMSMGMLSELTGLTRAAISAYERGKMGARAKNVHKLAKALNITPEELVRERPMQRDVPKGA